MPSKKNILAIDLHVHVDERVNFRKIPSAIRARGLDGAGIVTHNDFDFSQKVTKYLQQDREKIYFSGVEIDTADGHLLTFGLSEPVPSNRPVEETIQKVHDLGGVTIIPHPFMSHNSIGWKSYQLKAHGMEFYNGFAKIFLNFPNIMAKVAFKYNGFSPIGGSDSHHAEAIGTCYTLIEIDGEPTEAKILDAIRNHKTIPKKKPIDRYDIINFIKIVFTPKDGRKVVRFFDYF